MLAKTAWPSRVRWQAQTVVATLSDAGPSLFLDKPEMEKVIIGFIVFIWPLFSLAPYLSRQPQRGSPHSRPALTGCSVMRAR
jgi:hypothetical protein